MTSLQDVLDFFTLTEDWEERYSFLIDLGKIVPPLPDSLKTPETLVPGCTSRVWIVPKVEGGILTFAGESESRIVQGLLALLFLLYNGKPVSEVETVPLEKIFATLGLSQNLSPNRRSGFFAMQKRLKEAAKT